MAAKKTNSKATKKTTTKKRTNTKTNQVEVKTSRVNPQVMAILLCAAGLLTFFLAILKGEDGNIWNSIHQFFMGVFGIAFFLVPFVFLYFGILTAKEKELSHKAMKITFSVLIVVLLCTAIYLFGSIRETNADKRYFEALGLTYLGTAFPPVTSGAGLVGAILGYPLYKFLGAVPSVIVVIILIIVFIMLLTGVTLIDIENLAKKQVRKVKEHREERQRIREERYEQEYPVDEIDDSPREYRRRKSRTQIDIPIDDTPKRKQKKVNVELPKVNDPVDENRDQEIINIINNANMGITPEEELTVTDIAKRISSKKNTNKISEGAKVADPETATIVSKEEISDETDKVSKQIKKREKTQKSTYRFPPVRLLGNSTSESGSDAYDEMQKNANILISTLDSFNVKASIININRGPSVTRYELQPAPGVKVSKFTNLSDDIALALAASGVRIEAPIPGKAAVGIEVPNKTKSMVSLRELLDSDEFKEADSKLNCALGKDISGELVFTDLAKLPHLLIAGTTGSGKSVCVNALLMSILYKATPEEVKLLLIDPKMVEFSKYKGIPHLLVPVVSDVKKAAGALNWAVSEMLNRYKLFAEYECKDIGSYNQLIERNLEFMEDNHIEIGPDDDEDEIEQPCLEVDGLRVPTEKMSQIVIAIDELADLMMAAPSEVEESICRLAQMARAAGMHLILATQRPSVNVITGVIKANIPSRIALKVSSAVDSRTIIDSGGAEKLIGRGDMLYLPVGANKPTRVQCCFAKDEEIESVTSYVKSNSDSEYDENVEQSIRQITAEGIGTKKGASDSAGSDSDPDRDSLMDKAIEVVVDAGQASTSLLQRRLKVGYARAGRMIDDMEQMGIVGPHQGSKARDVLITRQEWLEMTNRLGSPNGEDNI